MSFLYPRTVKITRPIGQTDVGAQEYGGTRRWQEDEIVCDVPASIQAKNGQSRTHSGDLPAAPPAPVVWNIYMPLNAVARGVIQDRDVVTDDCGERYQVSAAYWNSLGYKLITIRLEAH